MVVPLVRRRFTVEEYHRMGEAGILSPDDRVELVDGEVVQMTPIGARHAACVARLYRQFQKRLDEAVVVWVQNPIRLGPHHEPQPDLVLLRPPLTRYAQRLPGPEDVLLVVEVSDTSLVYDRDVKLPLYASAGIPEVWIVDLEGEAVEVYRTPTAGRSREKKRVPRGGQPSLRAFPDLRLAVDEILG